MENSICFVVIFFESFPNDNDPDDNVDDDGDNDDDELATFIDSNYMIHESYILMILFNMN